MKDLIIFGMPGAGKGTQAELLTQNITEYSHLSTGDIFRAILSKPNAIGKYVDSRFNAGLLIDDQVTISLFNAYFYAVVDEKKYMLLDGYPRTITQLESFLEAAKQNNREVLGLFFDLPEQEAINRMVARGREGEDESVIQKRLEEYYTKTQPIVNELKKRIEVVTIDCMPSIEEIHKTVMTTLLKH